MGGGHGDVSLLTRQGKTGDCSFGIRVERWRSAAAKMRHYVYVRWLFWEVFQDEVVDIRSYGLRFLHYILSNVFLPGFVYAEP